MHLFRKDPRARRVLHNPFQQLKSALKVVRAFGHGYLPLRKPQCTKEPGIPRNTMGIFRDSVIGVVLVAGHAANIGFAPERARDSLHSADHSRVVRGKHAEQEYPAHTAIKYLVLLPAAPVMN